MTLASLSLVILAAFIHATWNLLAKRAAPAGAMFVFYSHLFAGIFYAPWALYVMFSADFTWNLPGLGAILLSAIIHLAYSLCLQRGYQAADFTVVDVAPSFYPVLSSFPALVLPCWAGEAAGACAEPLA